MSILDGISQCWALGEACHPWWEAWGAGATLATALVAVGALVIAWIGVGVTAASAVAVWKLGVAANAASGKATRIAAKESERNAKERERRIYREETEELLVLMQINFEISSNLDAMRDVVTSLRGAELGEALFVLDKGYRGKVLEDVRSIRFPVTKSVIERLHYLDRSVSGRLLRATGMIGYIQDVGIDGSAADKSEWYEEAHKSLVRILPWLIDDLTIVSRACADARERLSINRSGETE